MSLIVAAPKRLKSIEKHLMQSVLVGFVAALACTLWTAYWSVFYETPWIEGWLIFESLLVYWLVWSFAMLLVLPAILSDDFSK